MAKVDPAAMHQRLVLACLVSMSICQSSSGVRNEVGFNSSLPPSSTLPPTQKALIRFMQQFAGPELSSLTSYDNTSDNNTTINKTFTEEGFLADAKAAVGRRQKISARHPIILIPPLSGVELERKLDHKPDAPHFWCRRTAAWSLAWLSLLELIPGEFACWVDYMRRVPSTTTPGASQAPEGVEVRPVQSFKGGTEITFKRLVQALELLGWQREHDLLVHSYDFRLGPVDWSAPGGSFGQLQQQVEAAVSKAGRPAVVISFSLGAPYVRLFLEQQVSQQWKDQNVEALIALSGFWGGTPVAVLSLLSGVWLGTPPANQQLLLQLFRGMPSISYVLPSPGIFPENQLLASNTALRKNYTISDLQQLLRDAGAADPANYWQQFSQHYSLTQPLSVKRLYCMYGTGVPTVSGLSYSRADFSGQPDGVLYSDGDGTVPSESLSLCARWKEQLKVKPGVQSRKLVAVQHVAVVVKEYPGLVHSFILQDQQAFQDLLEFVYEIHAGVGSVQGSW